MYKKSYQQAYNGALFFSMSFLLSFWFCLALFGPPSDTGYLRFNSRLFPVELERVYTLTGDERVFCEGATGSDMTRPGFALLFKTYLRLGYFVTPQLVANADAATIESAAARRER